jgi:hypothetical protein
VGPILRCVYCGAQCRLDGPPGLVDAISFVTPTITIPFLDAAKPLPSYRSEPLSTQADDQDTLDVNLVQGATPHRAVPLSDPETRATRGRSTSAESPRQ